MASSPFPTYQLLSALVRYVLPEPAVPVTKVMSNLGQSPGGLYHPSGPGDLPDHLARDCCGGPLGLIFLPSHDDDVELDPGDSFPQPPGVRLDVRPRVLAKLLSDQGSHGRLVDSLNLQGDRRPAEIAHAHSYLRLDRPPEDPLHL